MRYGRRRAAMTETRVLTAAEAAALAHYVGEHWPGLPVERAWVEWNRYLVLDWGRDAWPVVKTRLPLDHVLAHAAPSASGVEPAGGRAPVPAGG
jgi:hypothetical protein